MLAGMPAESARHVAIGMVRTTIRRRQGAKLGLQIFQSKSSGLRGVSISAIDSGSVAEDAGLRVNDVITMVGDWICVDASRKEIAQAIEASGNNIALGVATRNDINSVADQLMKSNALKSAAAAAAAAVKTPARQAPSPPAHISPTTPGQHAGAVIGPPVNTTVAHPPTLQPSAEHQAAAARSTPVHTHTPTATLTPTPTATTSEADSVIKMLSNTDYEYEGRCSVTSSKKKSGKRSGKTKPKAKTSAKSKKSSPSADAKSKKAAKNKTGERRWKVVGTGNSVMQPLGLLDVKPDPVSHKNLNSLLLRKFDKEDHTSPGGWVGNGRRHKYRENIALRDKHEKAAEARREARATLDSKRSALREKLRVPSHIVKPKKSSTKKGGSGRSGSARKSKRPTSGSRVSSRVDSGLHANQQDHLHHYHHHRHADEDEEDEITEDDDDDDEEEEYATEESGAVPGSSQVLRYGGGSSAPLYSSAEAALAAARAELKNVRRDRKELLNELVQLTDSYDEIVKISEEQIEEAQRDHVQYAQRMDQELQEKTAELRYMHSRARSSANARTPPRPVKQVAPVSPSRGANISGVEELRSVIVVMEEALEAQENLLRIKQQAKEEDLATQAEQHRVAMSAIIAAVAEEEQAMQCTLPALRQALSVSSTVSTESVQARMLQEQELYDARSMIAALEDAVEAKERLLAARQATHDEDAAQWTGRTEVVVDEVELHRLRSIIANMDAEHDGKTQRALAVQQKSFNVVMSEMKMALVEAISAKGDLDRLANKSSPAPPSSSSSKTNSAAASAAAAVAAAAAFSAAAPTPIPAPRPTPPATSSAMVADMNDVMSLMKVQEELANVRNDLNTLRSNSN